MKFPGRILVADHSGNLDRFVCRVLGQDKWYIASADNVYDLEKAVYSEVPHILIINAHMPALRVKAFVDQIRHHYGDNRPHIILAVVKDVERCLKKGFAAGADDFLRVPFHAVELAAKINCAMRAVYLRYEYQRVVDEFNDQLANLAPHLFQSQQPVSATELHGEILPIPPATGAGRAGAYEEPDSYQREFPDPEHDMEPTTAMAQIPNAPTSGTDIDKGAAPPPPPRVAEQHFPPAPPENVIPMFQAGQSAHPTQAAEEMPDAQPVTDTSALDLGFGGRPVKKELRHRRSRIPQIQLDIPEDEEQVDEPSRRKMTLMLVKINGFGTVCEDLEAGTSARIIHNVYKELVREISRFGGKAINIQGDSLLATFTSSRQHQNHRMSAMQAALQLQIKAMFLDEKFPDLVGQIGLSIAIHTGMVTTANVGNSQSDTSIVGSAVTVVLRMLDHCDESQILVSQATYGSFRASVLVNQEHTIEVGRQQQPLALGTLNGMNARDLAMVGNMSFG